MNHIDLTRLELKAVVCRPVARQAERNQLECNVEAFLKNGGEIKQLSGVQYKPRTASKVVERVKVASRENPEIRESKRKYGTIRMVLRKSRKNYTFSTSNERECFIHSRTGSRETSDYGQ